MTLISVHLPKTAGTSFRASLKARFGDRYQDDYGDGGISVPVKERNRSAVSASAFIAERGLADIDCVHGHFLPVKYLPLGKRSDLTFVTWMRDPVARLFSHYHYWQETYDELSAKPHHRQVIEEQWTLEQFCLSEQFRNIYAQYLWGFPLENFGFIGISEHYLEDMLEFSRRFLSAPYAPQYLNPTKYTVSRPGLGKSFIQKVRDYHAADVQLYQRALVRRRARCRGESQDKPINTTAATSFWEA